MASMKKMCVPGRKEVGEPYFTVPKIGATGRGGARAELQAVLGSFLLHLILVGLAAQFGSFVKKRQTPMFFIDVTVESGPLAPMAGRSGGAGSVALQPAAVRPAAVRPAASGAVVQRLPAQPSTPQPVHAERPKDEAGKPAPTRVTTLTAPTPAPVTVTAPHMATDSAASSRPAEVQAGPGFGTGSGAHPGGGHTAVRGDGAGGGTAENLRARYLKQHFAYIRERIAQKMVYPRRAQGLGWSGRVVASFVVREDGGVDDLSVTTRSGVPLLDEDALETIRRAAPFPPPPVRARLSIPLDYTLK